MDQMSELSSVLNNPYLMERIVRELDIRTLFRCRSVSKDLFVATAYEYSKRKDLIHLYLLRYDSMFEPKYRDFQRLFQTFLQYSKLWLTIRPKHVLLLIGGYRHFIDYRLRKNSLQYMTQYLPKDCQITYLDVGHSVLTSSIRFKSLTNYSEHNNNSQSFQKTSFPCMSCLLIPEIPDIRVNVCESVSEVKTQGLKGLKALLFVQSSKRLKSDFKSLRRESKTRDSVLRLIACMEEKVSFGGGSVRATKTMVKSQPKDDYIRDSLIVTFSGHGIRSSSTVLLTTNSSTFGTQLLRFKNSLDFDCNDWQNSTTIAFVFANQSTFSSQFTTAFQSVFPFVGIFGFQSNDRMYGKNKMSQTIQTIDPKTSSVAVLVNFAFKQYKRR